MFPKRQNSSLLKKSKQASKQKIFSNSATKRLKCWVCCCLVCSVLFIAHIWKGIYSTKAEVVDNSYSQLGGRACLVFTVMSQPANSGLYLKHYPFLLVPLKMLVGSDHFLNQMVEILRETRSKAFRLKNSHDFITSRKTDLCHST